MDGPFATLVDDHEGFPSADEFGVGLTDTDLLGESALGITLDVGGVTPDAAGGAGPAALIHSDGIAPTGEEDTAVISKEDSGDVWRIVAYDRD